MHRPTSASSQVCSSGGGGVRVEHARVSPMSFTGPEKGNRKRGSKTYALVFVFPMQNVTKLLSPLRNLSVTICVTDPVCHLRCAMAGSVSACSAWGDCLRQKHV